MRFYIYNGIIVYYLRGASILSGFRTFWDGLDWSVLTDILMRVIPALVCITLHELAHGFIASRLGDDTARRAGRLTLNPVRHIDWMGLAMMAAFGFGWAKPVPVDMRNFRNPKTGMAITAAAGPFCNLLITIVLLFVYGLIFLPLRSAGTGITDFVLQTVLTTAYLSLSLAIFNLIPISPLDGSKVLFSFLSEEAYYKLMRYERYGMIVLLIVVATGVLGNPLGAATRWVFDKLFILAEWGFGLTTPSF